jgi:hypothetical protein
VTQPRAADDFATIRGRMEELRRVTRHPAADDFAVIRSRMEELRGERAQVSADPKGYSGIGPRPYHRAATANTEHQSGGVRPVMEAAPLRNPDRAVQSSSSMASPVRTVPSVSTAQ